MIHFINNIGDYFASNYFDDDFTKKVIEKSGYSHDAVKLINQEIATIKPYYFKLKQTFIENHLTGKDKVKLTYDFHIRLLKLLGYDTSSKGYNHNIFIDNTSMVPVRYTYYKGSTLTPQLMVMEMHAMIKTGEAEPDGLFEQSYTTETSEEKQTKQQKYHRSQWDGIFDIPEGVSLSPMIINKAVGEIFLLPEHRRPKYILLCAGNQYFLLESEKWFRGSYLQLDLEALFDDAAIDKDYYSVFSLLLGKELLVPNAERVLMEELEEDAHKAAYEVTKDLKEGVIHAVEKLANEAVSDLVSQGKAYNEINAELLKEDCLNMVYRLLFLFYAESREDLDILPSNDPVYDHGYSIEMLRDLEQVPLITESSRNGHFFNKSLFKLFELLHNGYREHWKSKNISFKIRHLDSPMFDPDNLHYLNQANIRNFVWQDIICELSLSKKQHKKGRGRISYANLGINQLGSVYESLLSFRGVLADTDQIEVHRKKKKNETSEQVVNSDGSFLVPRSRFEDFEHDEIYYDELADRSENLKVIPKGTFIYRLNGRDRQKSASYYTPEVLTQTTVKYTLKPILEKLDKGEIKALDLLELKILEPAMGAAAFHNEVINQLAQAYLLKRQKEIAKKVEPDKYQQELQSVKAYIALNNVYGVDINPTAVELGKLSLWLNVIHKDMHTPFFGYRLGVGNAVVGSWLKVYKVKDLSFEATTKNHKSQTYLKKEWWTIAPTHLKFDKKKGILRKEDEIYHFLLPDPDMASSANIKLLKAAYPDKSKRIATRRKEFTDPLKADEINKVKKIANAIDALLLEHYKLQRDIGIITKSNNHFFGSEDIVLTTFDAYSYEQKQEFAESRLKPNAPYYKLKQIMDYWCSLWFWDVRRAEDFPTRAHWYEDLVQILNIDLDDIHQNEVLEKDTEDEVKDYRKDKKSIEKQLSDALKQSTTSLFTNQRSTLIQQYAKQYKFFHYELEFIEVFMERNGFDVAVGNPPWLKIQFEEKGIMSETYPELEIRNFSAPKVKKLQPAFLSNKDRQNLYFAENIENDVSGVFLNAFQNYPLLKGQQTNLYKCVLENGLHWINENGYLGLIHPEGIYDDPKGYALRKEVYQRLKYHFQFVNVKKLFQEILHWVVYGINIYSGSTQNPQFISINNLFHPATIEGCLISNDSREQVKGLKYKDELNNSFVWNISPHPSRKLIINEKILRIYAETFENSEDWEGAKLVSTHTKEIVDFIEKIGRFPNKVANFENKISEGWHETNDVTGGFIQRDTKYPDFSKYEMIYSGPHIYVSNAFYKTPKEICTIPHDFNIIDLTKISEEYNPRTNYIPQNVTAGYSSIIKGFEDENGNYDNWLDYYKLAFRKMLSQSGERTLSGAIIPPKSSHVNGIISLIFRDQVSIIELSGLTSSLVMDFYLKTLGKSNLYDETIRNFPLGISLVYKPPLITRTILLNCLNTHYAILWEENYDPAFKEDSWSILDDRLKPFSSLTKDWTWSTPLRNYFERRMALVEIDVITAMALGLSLDELILLYDIQFPVLQQNEDDTWYDTKGNIVFTCSKGLTGVGVDRSDWEKIRDLAAGEEYEHTITKSELYQGEKVTYYAPFTKCDRVEDYKKAWAHFEKRFA